MYVLLVRDDDLWPLFSSKHFPRQAVTGDGIGGYIAYIVVCLIQRSRAHYFCRPKTVLCSGLKSGTLVVKYLNLNIKSFYYHFATCTNFL